MIDLEIGLEICRGTRPLDAQKTSAEVTIQLPAARICVGKINVVTSNRIVTNVMESLEQ